MSIRLRRSISAEPTHRLSWQCLRRQHWLGAALALLLLTCTTAAWAQSRVYSGGVTQNSNALDPANFPNENPLQVQPETMPASGRGCQPPDSSWRLLAESGNNCLYAAPLPAAAQQMYRGASVVPLQQITGIESQGGRCGVDPWNPNKAVCTPGVAQNRSTARVPNNGAGPVRRGKDACLPFGPGGYDYCQNPVGTQPAGCNCSKRWQTNYARNGETFGDPAQPTQYGLPLPGNVRAQLFQAAAQLDQIVDNGQGYGLAASNRFFKCMAEAVHADLEFLAQPRGVPAAQVLSSLHTGVWKYLTSNAYSNNLAAYDGAVQSMQHAMNDPACALGQAAPYIAAAAVTRLGGAVAEARGARAAASAAIGLNEEYTADGFGKWYVPGLRCPGCLVYGTAGGGYAQFAEEVGGYTINSLPKGNLTWNQLSQKAMENALSKNTPILFNLNGIVDIRGVLAGKVYPDAVTSFELRYLKNNWSRFRGIVRFYDSGTQVQLRGWE